MESRQMAARIALAIILALAAGWIGFAFIPAVLWAGVVAVAVDPLRRKMLGRLPGHHATVAGILTAAVALLVVVPLAMALTSALLEARGIAAWYAATTANGVPVPAWLSHIPWASERAIVWWQTHLSTPEGAAEQLRRLNADTILAHTKVVGQNVMHRAVIFGFSMTTLFFLIRDRDEVVQQLRLGATRAFGPAGERIGGQILASVRGTIDGLVLVGLAQGVIMAIAYAFAGVPHPILLGLLTGIGAMVPFGLLVVMLVALTLLLIKGAIVAAVVIGAFGFVLNFVADHWVRPQLIGGSTSLPFMWVLIGIVGGVETIGLLGLFVGPAVMAASILVWRDFIDRQPASPPQPGTPPAPANP
ncbi:AI-2E family transporter [Sphingomonas sp. 3-13AW]|uniref:AI-2E family transporter n=1 Tax=Sphingomonas sp. 3-13AW TaxID=3050450 RepID=UPI003BB53F3A